MKPFFLITVLLLSTLLSACNHPIRQGNPPASAATPIKNGLTSGNHNLKMSVDDGTSIEQQSYIHCSNGARVTAYIIRNGGHTWPPRESQLEAGGQATTNLDPTKIIVEFFLP